MSLSFLASWSIITCTMLANSTQRICLLGKQAELQVSWELQLKEAESSLTGGDTSKLYQTLMPGSIYHLATGCLLCQVEENEFEGICNRYRLRWSMLQNHAKLLPKSQWFQCVYAWPLCAGIICDSHCVASHPCAWCLVNGRSPNPAAERLTICPAVVRFQHNLLTCQAAPMHEGDMLNMHKNCRDPCKRTAGVWSQSCWWPLNHSAWLDLLLYIFCLIYLLWYLCSLPSEAHRGSSECHGRPK